LNCDRIARAYRWMEYMTFGPALHRRRCEFMKEFDSARSVLILGDGDGRFTAEFLRANATASIDSLESSEGMTRLAATRIAESPEGPARVRHFREDVRSVQLPGRYDLVVAHFFLDCFTTRDLETLIPRIVAHLTPGAQWLISEFQIPASGVRRYFAKFVIKALYVNFRVLTGLKVSRLPDHRQVLRANGYIRTAFKTGFAGMLVSEIWEHA
jgi:trans-aconitate methyltransferase